jgi:prevent-host-death family protein
MSMTRTITATEANQRFSEILRDVGAGDSFTVTSHGKPVAEIRPPKVTGGHDKQAIREMLDRMNKLPGVVTGSWTRDDLYDRDWV